MELSIIVPVYNTKDYLNKCVDSLLACDCTDCEILLIDDGSTDGESGALCDRLAEANSQIIRVIHQKNKGLGGARNTGIEAAKGEFLFFVDSDDWVVAGALDRLKEAVGKNPEADIVSFGFLLEDEQGVRPFHQGSDFNTTRIFTLEERPEYMLLAPNAWCRIWRKSLFVDHHIYFPDRAWYEDIRLGTKLFPLAKKIVWIPDALYVYYQRSGSIMNSGNVERNREIIDAFDDLLEWYKQQGLFKRYEATLQRLCVEHLYLAASVRVLRINRKHPLVKTFSLHIQKHFPDYRKANYRDMPGGRKWVLFLLNTRQYWLIALLFKMRDRLRRKEGRGF